MMKRFIKTTWRSLAKNKAFSLLNIVGLTIGIACAGLILLWVEFYTTFNSSIKDLPQLYEVKNNQVYGNDHHTFSALANLKTVFAKFDATQPFDYHFMDKDFEFKFKQERFTWSLAIIFGSLAIIISCLGLFRLSAFMAEQRTKELVASI